MKAKKGNQICGLNDILFPVELINNPRTTNSEYSKVVTGVINGVEMDLNYCSPVYELIKNDDIFPNIKSVLENNNIEHTVEYSHTNNVRFYANYRITDNLYKYELKNTNDFIEPLLRVQHSYNGLTKYRIQFGYFRLICSNGMVIPIEEMKQFNLNIDGKHTESIKKSFFQLDYILKNFVLNAGQITEAITKKYELLGGREVTNIEDRVNEVLNFVKITAVDNNKLNTLNYITNVIKNESTSEKLNYNGKVTDFLIYNGINQYINDNSLNIAAPEKRIETDSKIFEYMLVNA
jgi:hypothetical protein